MKTSEVCGGSYFDMVLQKHTVVISKLNLSWDNFSFNLFHLFFMVDYKFSFTCLWTLLTIAILKFQPYLFHIWYYNFCFLIYCNTFQLPQLQSSLAQSLCTVLQGFHINVEDIEGTIQNLVMVCGLESIHHRSMTGAPKKGLVMRLPVTLTSKNG